MQYVLIEGQPYLLWLVENILDAVESPLPGQRLVSLGRPQTALFESLIALKVLAIKPVPNTYDEFVKGECFNDWMLANTSMKPLVLEVAPTKEGGQSK